MTQFERIGRFQVRDRIGGDAFSLLYAGRDSFADRPVEIRICVAADQDFRGRFLKAAEEASCLRHGNIARVLEFGSGESKPYLVQEVSPGGTLKERLHAEEPVEDIVKLYYLLQLGQALQYAHSRGVLHQELSPHAVKVVEGERIKLGDFGIARLASAWIQLRGGGAVCPSAGYILPEALAGVTPDQRSEVFGFGATAYEMLTTRPAFPAETLPELVFKVLNEDPAPITSLWPQCPGELEAVVHKCLSLDPQRRYPGLDEVLDALSAVLPIPMEPAEEVSHERAMEREDSQTIYVVDPESLAESESTAESEVSAPDMVTRSVQEKPPIVLWTAIRRVAEEARRSLRSLDTVKSRIGGLSWRSWPVAAAVLLSFVVVGWGLANRTKAEPSSEPSVAVVAPSLPAVPQEVGLLALDAQPWAEVRRILDESGEPVPLTSPRTTPMTLRLPVGHYRVELSHPGTAETRECRVEVSASHKVDCLKQFASVDTADYFRLAGWWQ